MRGKKVQRRPELWRLARGQHGVVTRQQLLANGYTSKSIHHRIAIGGLHPVLAGVYAIGRPALTQPGRWMAAVLSCGPDAVLSHESAATLWMIRPAKRRQVDVSVPYRVRRTRPGIAIHRRSTLTANEHHTARRHPRHHSGLHPDRHRRPTGSRRARSRYQRRGQTRPDQSRGAPFGPTPTCPPSRRPAAPRVTRQTHLHADRLRARAPFLAARS